MGINLKKYLIKKTEGEANMNIGNLIYEIREDRGLSRAEASQGICSDKYIYMIENGDRVPSIKILYDLSHKLKYNFFHTLSYLSDKNPLALKDAINKFIEFRVRQDYDAIGSYIETLKASDHYHKESFRLLVAIHSAYLNYHMNTISPSTFKELKESFEMTEDLHLEDDIYDRPLSYLELMCLAIYEICNYSYNRVYNEKKLKKIYEVSKTMIRKDESVDIAITVLRGLSSLLTEYEKTADRCEYIEDFKIHLLDVLDQTSDTSEIMIAKQIISANIELISRCDNIIRSNLGEDIIQIYFLADNIVIFKTIGCNKKIFIDGLAKYYDMVKEHFGTSHKYHLIADFTSISNCDLPPDYFEFDETDETLINLEIEKNRLDTYIIIPILNKSVLEIILQFNKSLSEVTGFEPNVVSFCLDAIIDIILKRKI